MNSLNANFVDQQVLGIIEKYPDMFADRDVDAKKSAAFVLLCMSEFLGVPKEDAAEFLTDGGGDFGIDGLHMTDVEDSEFLVTIFQSKYKRDLSGNANFPENDVRKLLNTLSFIFDPGMADIKFNDKISPQIEDIRSLIRDGYMPNVRVVLCNNGKSWTEQAQILIGQSKLPVEWVHFNHDLIIGIQRRVKSVDETIQLSGPSIIDNFDYRRVLIGKARVSELAALIEKHGDRLLQRNIRRYLGLHSNRVNLAIHKTLLDPSNRNNFYFFNNGITIICKKFRHNAMQASDHKVIVEGLQIVNGGQTCKTIHHTLKGTNSDEYLNSYVMVRIYELEEDNKNFVNDVTSATNSQNPVDLRDLRSNDDVQKDLEKGISELGFTYKRYREDGSFDNKTITSSVVAEATLAVWREKPHQAKFRRSEHFGKLYELIFGNINAPQAVIAVMIFRAVENERKRPKSPKPPDFLPYSSHYISMLIGRALLKKHSITTDKISHNNFKALMDDFEANRESFRVEAVEKIDVAIKALYGDRKISLQQLSATFRGGGLLEELNEF